MFRRLTEGPRTLGHEVDGFLSRNLPVAKEDSQPLSGGFVPPRAPRTSRSASSANGPPPPHPAVVPTGRPAGFVTESLHLGVFQRLSHGGLGPAGLIVLRKRLLRPPPLANLATQEVGKARPPPFGWRTRPASLRRRTRRLV